MKSSSASYFNIFYYYILLFSAGAFFISDWGSCRLGLGLSGGLPRFGGSNRCESGPWRAGSREADGICWNHVGTWTFQTYHDIISMTTKPLVCQPRGIFGDQFFKKVLNLSNDSLVPQVWFGELPLPFGAELNRSCCDDRWGWEMHCEYLRITDRKLLHQHILAGSNFPILLRLATSDFHQIPRGLAWRADTYRCLRNTKQLQ